MLSIMLLWCFFKDISGDSVSQMNISPASIAAIHTADNVRIPSEPLIEDVDINVS